MRPELGLYAQQDTAKAVIIEQCAVSLGSPPLVRSGVFFCFCMCLRGAE